MISKEDVFKFMDGTKAVLTFKQFGNGDYVPFEGYITAIKYENNKITTVDLKSMYGDDLKNVPIKDLYLQEDIEKLKKVILLKEIELLPWQIENLEADLKHKKRKLERYQKQLEEMEKQKDEQ